MLYEALTLKTLQVQKQIGGNQHTEPDTLYLVKQEDGSFVFEKGMPNWMKDAPEVRPFHFDDETIKTGLEAANAGWEVLQIRKRRDGVLDEVTVDYSDGTNKLQTIYVVWEREDGTKDYKEKA